MRGAGWKPWGIGFGVLLGTGASGAVVWNFWQYAPYAPFVLPSLIALGHIYFKDWNNYNRPWKRWSIMAVVLATGLFGAMYQSQQLVDKATTATKNEVLQGKVDATLSATQGLAREFTSALAAISKELADVKTKAATAPLRAEIATLQQKIQANTDAVKDISEPKGVTYAQLKEAALDLVRRLRDFQIRISNESTLLSDRYSQESMAAYRRGDKAAAQKAFSEHSVESGKLRSRQQADFGHFCAEVEKLRTQLLNRLPTQPSNTFVDGTLKSGMLAGAYPVAEIATYLELLALKLPVR